MIGGLQVLQLASARGYLEDGAIVLQAYSILKRTSPSEAPPYLTFLSSAIHKEDRNELNISKTDVPLPFAMLICANHIKQSTNKNDKILFRNIIIEAAALFCNSTVINTDDKKVNSVNGNSSFLDILLWFNR